MNAINAQGGIEHNSGHGHDRGAGAAFVLGAAVFWSTSGLFIKLINGHPVVIAGARSLLAALFLISVRFIFQSANPRDIPRILKNPFVWAGGAAYGATMITFVIANKLTTSANAILLQYSAPMWAALLAWALLREKPHVGHWVGMALMTAGLVLFFGDSLAIDSVAGCVTAIFSGMVFGASSVFMRRVEQRRAVRRQTEREHDAAGSPIDCSILSHVLTALAAIPFAVLYPPQLTGPTVFSLIFMGVFQSGIASLLFATGIARISAVSAMLLCSVEPVLNPLWVFLITGETPTGGAVLGGALILAAVFVSTLWKRR